VITASRCPWLAQVLALLALTDSFQRMNIDLADRFTTSMLGAGE
jgi:hypothetical protein